MVQLSKKIKPLAKYQLYPYRFFLEQNKRWPGEYPLIELVDGHFKPGWFSRGQGSTPIIMNDLFYDKYNDPNRFQIDYGSGGSGKSHAKALEFLVRAYSEPYFRLLYLRKQFVDVRKSQFQLFKDIINEYNMGSDFRVFESTMDIVCNRNGNRFFAGGLDDVDKLKSIADITDAWGEEVIARYEKQSMSEDDITQLLIRLRTPKVGQPRLHLTFNPVRKDSFIYRDFFEHPVHKSVKITHSTYKHNAFASPALIETLEDLKRTRPNDYIIYHNGEWSNLKSGKEWTFNFSPLVHANDTINLIAGKDVHLMFDFNIQPYQTMLAGQVVSKNGIIYIRIFHEYCLEVPRNTPEDCCKDFIKDYESDGYYFPVKVYGDASGKHGVDAYRGIFQTLLPYTTRDKDQVDTHNSPVSDRRDLINDILAEKYDIRILIDKHRCPNLVKDLETLQEAPDGFDPEYQKINEHRVETKGHCYSAFSYFIARLFPDLLRKNRKY